MKQKFSKRIYSDTESSFISCPEYVAEHIANNLKHFETAIELCCCVGVTSIQLAKCLNKVIAVDIDESRIKKARQNAKLYGVSNKIRFIAGDVLDESLLRSLNADVAVLDPGWAKKTMDRSTFVSDINLTRPSLKEMFQLTKRYLTDEIVLRIPATFTFDTLKEFGHCKIENIIVNNKIIFKAAYFFDNIKKNYEENHIFSQYSF